MEKIIKRIILTRASQKSADSKRKGNFSDIRDAPTRKKYKATQEQDELQHENPIALQKVEETKEKEKKNGKKEQNKEKEKKKGQKEQNEEKAKKQNNQETIQNSTTMYSTAVGSEPVGNIVYCLPAPSQHPNGKKVCECTCAKNKYRCKLHGT